MAKFRYSCLGISAEGKYVPITREVGDEEGPFFLDGNLIRNRADMLEIINKWNAQGLHTKEYFPRYIYYLQ